MLKLRRHIALLFIFCTLIVQTPRAWLHDCHDLEFGTHSHTESSIEEDCSICNQPALICDDPTTPEINFNNSYSYQPYPSCAASSVFITGGLIQNKAPPVLPC